LKEPTELIDLAVITNGSLILDRYPRYSPNTNLFKLFE